MVKNENPIILDRWESQLIWYAKGWLEDKDISTEDALKHLWGNRCALLSKHVEIRFIAKALIKLIIKLNLFDNLDYAISSLLEGCSPQSMYSRDIDYTENKGYYVKICWVCLFNFISTCKVYDGANQTDPRFILLPFEPELFNESDYDKRMDK